MTGNRDDHRIWRNWLKPRDPIAPAETAQLAALEDRIMAQIDTLPATPSFAGWPLPALAAMDGWTMRGACAAAVLVAALGFFVGRDINLLVQNPDGTALFASADSTPWQSFLSAPTSGEIDDAE
jgi:hypothetical protein